MNPLVGIITLAVILLVVFLPRRWAVLAVVSGVCYVTQSEFLSLSGIDFTPIRFIVLAGFIRVILRKEFSFSKLNKIDKCLLIFSSVYLIVYLLRSRINPGSHSLPMYRLGQFCEAMLTYFTFRGLLKNPSTFRQFLNDMVFLILPFTLFMINESVTGKNIFSIMGGVSEIPRFRDGHYRCQASFRHAITAGTFGATLVPLFIGLAYIEVKRVWAVIGIISGTLITISSHSSGPLMAFMAGVIAWMVWPLRRRMKMVLWAIVGFFVLLQLVMKVPVWFLHSKISGIIGGDGFHRSKLIDSFIINFQDWWLMGMPDEGTANWTATKMRWGGVDVTNEYVAVGINGGLISLILYIWLLVSCYQLMGRAMKKIRRIHHNERRNEVLLWAVGCVLFAHIANLTAVTYFDQLWAMWYMLLAIISGLTGHYLGLKPGLVRKRFIKKGV
ncbi:MAG: hypothetical protein GY797_19460 [Deltaproteobacteria bacterium]|nr:hypothetical protein [Deltaproteobacteria bacterium]